MIRPLARLGYHLTPGLAQSYLFRAAPSIPLSWIQGTLPQYMLVE